MTNITNEFEAYLLRKTIPDTPSYVSWIKKGNIKSRLIDIENKYKQTYERSPFEIDLLKLEDEIKLIQSNLKLNKEPFYSYDADAQSGIPNSLLNKHFALFVNEYNDLVNFDDLQSIVNHIHLELGNFCWEFQQKRVDFNGNSRLASTSLIFGEVRDDYWTINKGSEKELQYHLFFDGKRVGYGLAFNAQASQNNTNPIEKVTPFINSFFRNVSKIKATLSDYKFIVSDEFTLKNIKTQDFVCFGKTIENKSETDNQISIKKIDIINMINDLRSRQFEAYKIIFESSLSLININEHNIAMENILKYKKQIILQGPPGTGKTREAKDLAELMIFGTISSDKKEQTERLESCGTFKLIQFHPSFTYEDFVRGIIAEPNKNGSGILYEAQNKILGKFAEDANENYLNSLKKQPESIPKRFLEDILSKLDINDKYEIGDGAFIKKHNNELSYNNNSWNLGGDNHRILSPDLFSEQYLDPKLDEADWSSQPFVSNFPQQQAFSAPFKRAYDRFKNNLNKTDKNLQNYLLIIDEINRANLSSVLGELIYALEYRGEAIESMYKVDKSNKLVLPPNLYIIGTMNTADRSVGYIDYAIRRRFAFVDVLPKDLRETLGTDFHFSLFDKITSLFNHETNLSKEFDRDDVRLGHSYFIQQYEKDENGNTTITPYDFNLRLQYEIKPILLEYVKDGILIGQRDGKSIKDFIKDLIV